MFNSTNIYSFLPFPFVIESLVLYRKPSSIFIFLFCVCEHIYIYACKWQVHRTVNTDILFPYFLFMCIHRFCSLYPVCLYCFALQVCHKCVSFSTGVILPVHCVCGLHHAAVLYAGRHHRQCPDLRFSHHCIERLPVHHSWSHGTNSVAGKAIKHKCGLMVGDTLIYKSNESPKYTHTSVYSNCVLYYLISINLWLY